MNEHSDADDPLRMLDRLAGQYDRFDMARVIERIPDQIDIALAQQLPSGIGRDYERVVILGMGGSALPADVLADAFLGRFTVPIEIVRSYDIPPGRGGRTLIVASSFSGNTEEVLHAIDTRPPGADVVALCAGGQLEALAHDRGHPLVTIDKTQEPEGMQPRNATGYSVTLLARLLYRSGVLSQDPSLELRAAAAFLRGVDLRSAAVDTALWLGDRIPVVYTDESHVTSVARIAKIKFNENAKRPAMFNAIPETNHNEMIGFSKALGEFGVLYLRDPTGHPRVQHRYATMKKVFADEGLTHVGFREWTMPGGDRLQRLLAAMVFADWCSYATALLDGLDPTPVELVESFKRLLGPI